MRNHIFTLRAAAIGPGACAQGQDRSACHEGKPPTTCYVTYRFPIEHSKAAEPAEPAQIEHNRGRGDDPYSLEDLARIARKLSSR